MKMSDNIFFFWFCGIGPLQHKLIAFNDSNLSFCCVELYFAFVPENIHTPPVGGLLGVGNPITAPSGNFSLASYFSLKKIGVLNPFLVLELHNSCSSNPSFVTGQNAGQWSFMFCKGCKLINLKNVNYNNLFFIIILLKTAEKVLLLFLVFELSAIFWNWYLVRILWGCLDFTRNLHPLCRASHLLDGGRIKHIKRDLFNHTIMHSQSVKGVLSACIHWYLWQRQEIVFLWNILRNSTNSM